MNTSEDMLALLGAPRRRTVHERLRMLFTSAKERQRFRDKEFECAILRIFDAALDAAGIEDRDREKFDEELRRKIYFTSRIERSRTKQTMISVSRGLNEGVLSIRDGDDMAALFAYVENSGYQSVDDIIGYYIDRNEFFDIIKMTEDEYYEFLVAGGRRENGGHVSVVDKIRRLYEFDSVQVNEFAHVDNIAGDDENLASRLPLEMRAHLSGFYDSVLGDDASGADNAHTANMVRR